MEFIGREYLYKKLPTCHPRSLYQFSLLQQCVSQLCVLLEACKMPADIQPNQHDFLTVALILTFPMGS